MIRGMFIWEVLFKFISLYNMAY